MNRLNVDVTFIDNLHKICDNMMSDDYVLAKVDDNMILYNEGIVDDTLAGKRQFIKIVRKLEE